jgi:hypothetical protein
MGTHPAPRLQSHQHRSVLAARGLSSGSAAGEPRGRDHLPAHFRLVTGRAEVACPVPPAALTCLVLSLQQTHCEVVTLARARSLGQASVAESGFLQMQDSEGRDEVT